MNLLRHNHGVESVEIAGREYIKVKLGAMRKIIDPSSREILTDGHHGFDIEGRIVTGRTGAMRTEYVFDADPLWELENEEETPAAVPSVTEEVDRVCESYIRSDTCSVLTLENELEQAMQNG